MTDLIYMAHADTAEEYGVPIRNAIKPTNYPFPVVEYIRADLARPMTVAEAAIARGQDVVDYYEQCVCDAKTDSQRYIVELQMNAAKSVLRHMSETP